MSMKINDKIQLALSVPSAKFKYSYLSYIKEVVENDAEVVPFVLNTPVDDFDALLKELDGYTRGENMQPGFVPHTTYWLVENDKEVVGATNIRHELTEKLKVEGGHIGYGIRPSSRGKGYGTAILELALPKAKQLGLERVLVTCDKDNIRSAKVILRNGGELSSEVYSEDKQATFQLYWIDLI